MPLSCDCYPGCWAEHSKLWERIYEDPEVTRQECMRRIPHGTYVKMPDHVRVESDHELNLLKKPVVRFVNSLGLCWAVRFVGFDGARYVQVNWIKRSYDEALWSLRQAYFLGTSARAQELVAVEVP